MTSKKATNRALKCYLFVALFVDLFCFSLVSAQRTAGLFKLEINDCGNNFFNFDNANKTKEASFANTALASAAKK